MLLIECKQTSPCSGVDGKSDFTWCRFLLARLTFDSLVGQKNLKAIKDTLDKLSEGAASLDSAYDDAMRRIEDQHPDDRDLAKKSLLWMSQGQRLLSVAEIQQAVAIELGGPDLDPDSTVDCDDIISACAGLVARGRDSLRLVHYTTQEYLQRKMTKYCPDAQEYLASSCLTYLLFDVVSEPYVHLVRTMFDLTILILESGMRQKRFSVLAAKNAGPANNMKQSAKNPAETGIVRIYAPLSDVSNILSTNTLFGTGDTTPKSVTMKPFES